MLVQQLPALLGVVVGALATYAVQAASERARWRREQSVRWDQSRVQVYAEYSHAIKKLISVAQRIAAHRGAHRLGESLSPEEGRDLLAAAEEERGIRWEAVLLLGSVAAVRAGREWQRSVFRLQQIARGLEPAESWTAAVEVASRARGAFYEVARRDLGLPSDSASHLFDWQFNALEQTQHARNAQDHAG